MATCDSWPLPKPLFHASLRRSDMSRGWDKAENVPGIDVEEGINGRVFVDDAAGVVKSQQEMIATSELGGSKVLQRYLSL